MAWSNALLLGSGKKSDRVYAMVQDMIAKKVPIDGVGTFTVSFRPVLIGLAIWHTLKLAVALNPAAARAANAHPR